MKNNMDGFEQYLKDMGKSRITLKQYEDECAVLKQSVLAKFPVKGHRFDGLFRLSLVFGGLAIVVLIIITYGFNVKHGMDLEIDATLAGISESLKELENVPIDELNIEEIVFQESYS